MQAVEISQIAVQYFGLNFFQSPDAYETCTAEGWEGGRSAKSHRIQSKNWMFATFRDISNNTCWIQIIYPPIWPKGCNAKITAIHPPQVEKDGPQPPQSYIFDTIARSGFQRWAGFELHPLWDKSGGTAWYVLVVMANLDLYMITNLKFRTL